MLLLVAASAVRSVPPDEAAGGTAPGVEVTGMAPGGAPGCRLFEPGAERAEASECLACHGVGRGASAMRLSHAVGIDYAAAQAANPNGLRPTAEVVRRGVLLPDGKLQCVTCHDRASRWAKHLALPPGSVATPAVDPRDPATYLRDRNWRTARATDPTPPAGSAVTPSPLCAACHTLAD